MSDDLLKKLAKVNRESEMAERSRLDERWDRLSAGELSAQEEAELRSLAETSEEARTAWEAFRPLGPDFEAGVVQAIRRQGLAPAAGPAVAEPAPKLLPFRRRTRLAGWSALSAAAAAAVLVLVLRPQAPLPVYSSLEIHGDQILRGAETEPAEVTVLAPGDRIQGVLTIETASRARDLEARYFLLRGQDLRRLEAQSQIDPGGAVKMKGSIGRDLPPGIWTLWAVVARRGELPDPAGLRRLSGRAQIRGENWVAVPREIRIQPRDLSP